MPADVWSLDNIFWFGASVLLWGVSICLGAVIWQLILKDLRFNLKMRSTIIIYALAQFGKYLPGNVAHHVGRVVLAKRAGVSARATAHSMLIEFLWGVSAASSVALLGLAYFKSSDNAISPIGLVLVSLLAMLLPWAGVRIVNAFLPSFTVRLTGGGPIVVPRLRTMLLVSLAFVTSFFIMGTILNLQARFIFGATDGRLLMLSGIFAWSWIAGYLTPGAPAGLGVREVVLVSLLTPIYGESIAVGLSLSLRLATTLGDGVCFLLALLAQRLLKKHLIIAGSIDEDVV